MDIQDGFIVPETIKPKVSIYKTLCYSFIFASVIVSIIVGVIFATLTEKPPDQKVIQVDSTLNKTVLTYRVFETVQLQQYELEFAFIFPTRTLYTGNASHDRVYKDCYDSFMFFNRRGDYVVIDDIHVVRANRTLKHLSRWNAPYKLFNASDSEFFDRADNEIPLYGMNGKRIINGWYYLFKTFISSYLGTFTLDNTFEEATGIAEYWSGMNNIGDLNANCLEWSSTSYYGSTVNATQKIGVNWMNNKPRMCYEAFPFMCLAKVVHTTLQPTIQPTHQPTIQPTGQPTSFNTSQPTLSPSL